MSHNPRLTVKTTSITASYTLDDNLVVHGDKGKYPHLGQQWKPKQLQDLIDEIKDLDKYKNNPFMPIEIESCNVGATNIPQTISDGTGRPVKAYGSTYFPGVGSGFYPKIFYPRVESGRI